MTIDALRRVAWRAMFACGVAAAGGAAAAGVGDPADVGRHDGSTAFVPGGPVGECPVLPGNRPAEPDAAGGELVDPADVQDGNELGFVGGPFFPDTPSVPVLPGDVNRDRVVDFADVVFLLTEYGLCRGDDGTLPQSDTNASGCVDMDDLAILLANMGRSA